VISRSSILLCALICLVAAVQAQPSNDPNFRPPAEESTVDSGPLSMTVGGTMVGPTWLSGHSGFAVGLEAIRVAHLGTSLENTPSMHRWLGLYALNGRWRFQSRSDFFWGANRWHAELEPRYDGLRTVYRGIGNPAPFPATEHYEPSDFRLRSALYRRLTGPLRMGVIYDLQDHRVHETDADGQLPLDAGLMAQQGTVAGIGLALGLDTRNALFNPSRGLFGQISAVHFSDQLGGHQRFDEYEIDLRSYLPLATDHTLAWQGYALVSRGSTPFWRLPSVGELPHSRAYDALRLRAKTLVAAQLEWRWRISRRIGCEVYAGAAGIDDDLGSLRSDLLLPTVGASLRIFRAMNGELEPMRIGAAWGDDGWRMEVGVGDAF